ncbi:MAG: hypothetical protein NTX27_22420, partial [Verrucomicrobia bacterium]|nr:hypothetical protein [Verrucomicrobiota bacterium]
RIPLGFYRDPDVLSFSEQVQASELTPGLKIPLTLQGWWRDRHQPFYLVGEGWRLRGRVPFQLLARLRDIHLPTLSLGQMQPSDGSMEGELGTYLAGFRKPFRI